MSEFGKLKGAQSEALCEAVRLWLAFRGKARFFAVVGPDGVQVLTWEQVKEKLLKELRERRVHMGETAVLPLFDTFSRDELRDVLNVVRGALGEPKEAGSLEDLEHYEDQVIFAWKVREGRDGYDLRFTLRMSFRFIGYSRLWSRDVVSVKDLQEFQKGEGAYRVKRVERPAQPT